MTTQTTVPPDKHTAIDTEDATASPTDIRGFTGLYDRMNRDTLHSVSACRAQLATIYHPAVVFSDPFHTLNGLDALSVYFHRMYRSVDAIHFQYGHYWHGEQADFLRWHMTYCHPSIGKGKAIDVNGGTELVWQDQRVIRHTDLFDAGAMLYEHLPVMGWAIDKIRERMA